MPYMYHKADCQGKANMFFGRLNAYKIVVISILISPSCFTGMTGSCFLHMTIFKEETGENTSHRGLGAATKREVAVWQ